GVPLQFAVVIGEGPVAGLFELVDAGARQPARVAPDPGGRVGHLTAVNGNRQLADPGGIFAEEFERIVIEGISAAARRVACRRDRRAALKVAVIMVADPDPGPADVVKGMTQTRLTAPQRDIAAGGSLLDHHGPAVEEQF